MQFEQPSLLRKVQQALLVPKAVHCADGVRRHEGTDILAVHKVDEFREIVFRKDGFNLHLGLSLIPPHHLVEGNATAYFVHNEIGNLLIVIGDDVHTDFGIDVAHEIVDDYAVYPRPDETDDNQFGRIDCKSGATDETTSNADGSTKINMQIFVYYLMLQ